MDGAPAASASASTWRDAAYVAAVRAACAPAQFSRFKRLYRETFYVLDLAAPASPGGDSIVAAVTVSGSTVDSRYVVRVRETGQVTCTCMDAAVNCARLGCVCKHACFAMVRVFRLGDAAVCRWLQTGGARRLEPEDVRAVAALVGVPAAIGGSSSSSASSSEEAPDIDALCAALDRSSLVASTSGRGGRKVVDFSAAAITRLEPGDECPVCYCELADDLRGCPDCGRAVHAECARRWVLHAARPTCVYCRSAVWVSFRGGG